MTETLEITTEQINDLPLLLGLVEEMGICQQIDGCRWVVLRSKALCRSEGVVVGD